MTQDTANLPATTADKAPLSAGGKVAAIVPANVEQAWRMAQAVHAASMAPKGFTKPEQIMVAMMHGMEVGLTPMAALQSIAVVNGMPTIWGDGALGLVRASGLLDDFAEEVTGDGMAMVATCTVRRVRQRSPVVRTFSAEDAKRAGLWGKSGPWQSYPRRMLQMRARSYALRDGFADVLRGLHVHEEARDITPYSETHTVPSERVTIAALEAQAEDVADVDPETGEVAPSEPEAPEETVSQPAQEPAGAPPRLTPAERRRQTVDDLAARIENATTFAELAELAQEQTKLTPAMEKAGGEWPEECRRLGAAIMARQAELSAAPEDAA